MRGIRCGRGVYWIVAALAFSATSFADDDDWVFSIACEPLRSFTERRSITLVIAVMTAPLHSMAELYKNAAQNVDAQLLCYGRCDHISTYDVS